MKPSLYNALITPFNDNDEIDYDVLDLLCRKIEETHDGIVLAGSTGEGESLNDKEAINLISYVKNYKFKKIININEDCTQKVIDSINLLSIPEDWEILVRVPAYYLPTEEGIIEHFKKIFSYFPNHKFIIYDIEKRTNSKLSLKIVNNLINHTNFVGIKECNKNYEIMDLLHDRLQIYCGDDTNYIEYLNHYACGIISVFSILDPDIFNYINSNYPYINEVQIKKHLDNLVTKELNPIGIKRMLKLNGYKSMNLRLPLKY